MTRPLRAGLLSLLVLSCLLLSPFPSRAGSSGGLAAGEAPALRATRGEVVPRMLHPNLLPNGDFDLGVEGWTLLDERGAGARIEVAQTEAGPALRIHKPGWGPVRLVTDPIPVRPGARELQVTGLYHTRDASFGSMAELTLLQFESAERAGGPLPPWRPSPSALVAHRSLFNSKEGDWRRKTRTFALSPQTTHVRLVLTLEGPPVTVLLDNLYLAEPGESERLWSEPARELPTALAARQRMLLEGRLALEERPDSTAVVKLENGVPRLWVDGILHVPQIHMGDVSNPARSYFREFGEYNVPIHIVSLRNVTQRVWTGYRQYDLAKVDAIMWDAVLREPDGYFIVHLDLTAYPAWHEEFPEHAAQDRNGAYATSRHGHYAPPDYWSLEYRDQAYHFIRTLVEHIHGQLYGKAVIGYFITGGEDGQFYYQVARQTIQDGNAPGALPLFRQWLAAKYPTVEALREAWGDPDLTFESAMPPIADQKYPGTFMDPKKNRKEVDFLTYLNEELARFLVEAARLVKQTAPKEVIAGAYYGRGASLLVYPMHAQTSVMLKSEWIDFMGGQPGYYGWRDPGSSGHLTWVFDSVRTHGKLMMVELDYRTWKSRYESLSHDFNVGRYWNMDDLYGAAARELGKMLSLGGGAWWMEMTGGWFHDDEIMEMIGRLHDVSQRLYESGASVSPADIVFVADERSYFWTTEQYNVVNGANLHSLNTQQRAINRSGVKYDFYYLDDLIEGELDHYKVYVFLNLYYLTDEVRAFIDERLKRDGKVLVWQYAPGYVTPEALSLESMAALTGIRLGTDGGSLESYFAGEARAGAPQTLLDRLGGVPVGLGFVPVMQRFYVDDPAAAPLAYYTDGRVAAAVKEMGTYTSVYLGHPSGLTPQFIANLAVFAGVHTYLEPGDMFMHHRDDLAVIHGVEGGQKVLRLPFPARVTDLLAARVLAEEAQEVAIRVEPGQTLWLQIER